MTNDRHDISDTGGIAVDADRASRSGRRGLRARVRRIVGAGALAVMLSTALSVVGPAPAAHAQITSASASMRCGGGVVNVDAPQVRSTYRDNLVIAAATLYYRSGSRWIPLATGAPAYAYTQHNGWDYQWYYWSNNHGLLWWNWNVTPGYDYAVKLTIGDARDGHVTEVWARTVSGYSSCRA